MRPVDGVTLDEAARILGCSVRTLVRHIDAGRLPAGPKNQRRRVSRADAETLALQLRSSRAAFDPDTSYWIGASAAARILGVNVTRLNQLVANGRIPNETHADAGASTGASSCSPSPTHARHGGIRGSPRSPGRARVGGVRWFIASMAAVTVFACDVPCAGCRLLRWAWRVHERVGLRTRGNSESCDTLGAAVSLAAAVLVFVLIAWGRKYLRASRH